MPTDRGCAGGSELEQMFAFLPGPVVMLMNDDRFGPELRETVYAGAVASMPAHSVIYALMPSEQRVGLSDCEEVTGEFSNSWTSYKKPQKLYSRTVLSREESAHDGMDVDEDDDQMAELTTVMSEMSVEDIRYTVFGFKELDGMPWHWAVYHNVPGYHEYVRQHVMVFASPDLQASLPSGHGALQHRADRELAIAWHGLTEEQRRGYSQQHEALWASIEKLSARTWQDLLTHCSVIDMYASSYRYTAGPYGSDDLQSIVSHFETEMSNVAQQCPRGAVWWGCLQGRDTSELLLHQWPSLRFKSYDELSKEQNVIVRLWQLNKVRIEPFALRYRDATTNDQRQEIVCEYETQMCALAQLCPLFAEYWRCVKVECM